jgi:hypothetical protein
VILVGGSDYPMTRQVKAKEKEQPGKMDKGDQTFIAK